MICPRCGIPYDLLKTDDKDLAQADKDFRVMHHEWAHAVDDADLPKARMLKAQSRKLHSEVVIRLKGSRR